MKAYGVIPQGTPIGNLAAVARLDLETAEGLRGFLAATLAGLAQLPLDTRTANAIGALATAQRGIITTSDIEARLAALEHAAAPRSRAG